MVDGGSDGAAVQLPFDPAETIANLRYERYRQPSRSWEAAPIATALRRAYYTVRPLLPTPARRQLQRLAFRNWEQIQFPQWPVDTTVESLHERLLALWLTHRGVDAVPFIWFWPDGAPACAIMTHDVETLSGRNFCAAVMDLDDAAGIKASFQIVPERRYPVPPAFLDDIRRRGFEINVHDLNHDGYLFTDRQLFLKRAAQINRYAREYGATGFRSGALYRNLDWYHAFDFSYDMSVPTTGHLEAQRGGCCSVTPFFVGPMVELPVTTTQDYSLVHILKQYSIDLWKRQIQIIEHKHGLASFIVHPDYVRDLGARNMFKELLAYLGQLRRERGYWIARPGDVDTWWRQRSQMTLVRDGSAWRIEGAGAERARVAYASVDGDRIAYRIDGITPASADAPPERARLAVG